MQAVWCKPHDEDNFIGSAGGVVRPRSAALTGLTPHATDAAVDAGGRLRTRLVATGTVHNSFLGDEASQAMRLLRR
jgi:hypothetical protein